MNWNDAKEIGAAVLPQRDGGGREPIIFHRIATRCISAERETFALCGEYVRPSRALSFQGHGDGDGDGRPHVLCPMCEMEYEAMTADGKAWWRRYLYGDSGDPLREAVRAVSLAALEKADVTLAEVATRAGLDPKRLHRHVMNGEVSMLEMKAIADAVSIPLWRYVGRVDRERETLTQG